MTLAIMLKIPGGKGRGGKGGSRDLFEDYY